MKKKIIMFLVLLCIGLIINYSADNFNITHITTDSGFDVDYGSSSSSSSWDYSSSYDDDNSSSYDYNSNNDYSSSGGGSYNYGSTSKNNSISILGIIAGFVLLLPQIAIYGLLFWYLFGKKNKNNANETNFTSSVKLPVDPKDKQLLDEAYNIFIGVQNAWMNFDYNKLRELVTDELYNMYYNQLQTLSIKGEKNIMQNFNFIDSYIISRSINNIKNLEQYNIHIKVSFYDYVVDSSNNVIRGNKDKLVNMEYELIFVKSVLNVDTCPVCGAKIENGVTTCPYCRSHIQGVSSKMKLSSKKGLRQW